MSEGKKLLVVIDPEDLDAAEGLLRSYLKHAGGFDGPSHPHFIGAMANALREFARPMPLKPDEPQGLGAVVEDIEGERWVRTDRDSRFPWDPVNPDLGGGFHWRQIGLVRVLSEGMS